MTLIHILLGPTSAGKTNLAIELAKKYKAEIISADSRQIYKHMDLGTGKIPTDRSYQKTNDHYIVDGIKIWGYDMVNPGEFFSAVDFRDYAEQKISEIIPKKNIFIVGGTGFYIDVLTYRVTPEGNPPDFKLRSELQGLSLSQLQELLKTLAPDAYEIIDIHNPSRLIRAIEKAKTSRSVVSTITKSPYIFKTMGLTSDRANLYKRADAWVEALYKGKFLDEAKWLFESEYKDAKPLQGLIYSQAYQHLYESVPLYECVQKTKYAVHAYIRRQQTYFKKIPNVMWLDISQDNVLEKGYNIVDG